jgi:hypothetical protein
VKESSPKVAAPSSRFFAVAGSNWKHPQVHLERPVTHGDEEVEGEGEEEQEDEDPHEEAEEEQRTQVPAPKRQAFLPPQKKKRSGAEHRQRGQRGSKRISIIRPR